MKAQRSELVGNRIDLAFMLNAMKLTFEAVEVGTDRGVFAREFLERWKGEQLYCIDNWLPYEPGMFWSREGDFAFAVNNLAPFSRRCHLARIDSLEASQKLAPVKFDFVYIDGDHNYEAVVRDLEAWWPRVNAPGCFAGHDYDRADVQQAVDEFAERHGLFLQRTSDFNSPSWFVMKDSE